MILKCYYLTVLCVITLVITYSHGCKAEATSQDSEMSDQHSMCFDITPSNQLEREKDSIFKPELTTVHRRRARLNAEANHESPKNEPVVDDKPSDVQRRPKDTHQPANEDKPRVKSEHKSKLRQKIVVQPSVESSVTSAPARRPPRFKLTHSRTQDAKFDAWNENSSSSKRDDEVPTPPPQSSDDVKPLVIPSISTDIGTSSMTETPSMDDEESDEPISGGVEEDDDVDTSILRPRTQSGPNRFDNPRRFPFFAMNRPQEDHIDLFLKDLHGPAYHDVDSELLNRSIMRLYSLELDDFEW